MCYMNEALLKERERLYNKKNNLRNTQFNIKNKNQSHVHYEEILKTEAKYEFYDKFIKALRKSESS